MDSTDKFWLLFWMLMIQIAIVAYSMTVLWAGKASVITWYNIILNTVFGIMNMRLMFKILSDG